MQRPRALVLSLVFAAMAGSATLVGCGGGSNQTVVSASMDTVGAKSFTFASGSVLNAGLAGQATTVAFNGTGSRFSVAAGVSRATGANSFGSCTFTVGNSTNPDAAGGGSNFAAGTGPQPRDVIALPGCEFNSSNATLSITNSSGGTANSSGGTASTGGFGG